MDYMTCEDKKHYLKQFTDWQIAFAIYFILLMVVVWNYEQRKNAIKGVQLKYDPNMVAAIISFLVVLIYAYVTYGEVDELLYVARKGNTKKTNIQAAETLSYILFLIGAIILAISLYEKAKVFSYENKRKTTYY